MYGLSDQGVKRYGGTPGAAQDDEGVDAMRRGPKKNHPQSLGDRWRVSLLLVMPL